MSGSDIAPGPWGLPTTSRDIIIATGIVYIVAATIVVAAVCIVWWRSLSEDSVEIAQGDIELAVRNPDRARAELPSARPSGNSA
jgi:hypothetical protein